jgi:phage terminase small subunit
VNVALCSANRLIGYTRPERKETLRKRETGVSRKDNGRVTELEKLEAEMNLRQSKFAQNYVISGNAKKAYVEAGYETTTEGSAEASASALLRNPKVAAWISEYRRQAKKELRDWPELVEDAKAVLVDLLWNGKSESVRLNAAIHVLDRVLGKPTQTLNLQEVKEQASKAVVSYAKRKAELAERVREESVIEGDAADAAAEVVH